MDKNSYTFAARPKSVEHFALQRTGLHPHPREPNPEFVASFASRSQKFVTQFALLSFTCSFSPPAWFCPRATFELGKELRSSQSFSPVTCWPASVAFQVVLILLGGC